MAYAESVGPGPELLLTEEAVTVDSAFDQLPNVWRWKHQLTVPANTLPEENPGPGGPSGVYKLVVTAFLDSTLGPSRLRHHGLCRGPDHQGGRSDLITSTRYPSTARLALRAGRWRVSGTDVADSGTVPSQSGAGGGDEEQRREGIGHRDRYSRSQHTVPHRD